MALGLLSLERPACAADPWLGLGLAGELGFPWGLPPLPKLYTDSISVDHPLPLAVGVYVRFGQTVPTRPAPCDIRGHQVSAEPLWQTAPHVADPARPVRLYGERTLGKWHPVLSRCSRHAPAPSAGFALCPLPVTNPRADHVPGTWSPSESPTL